MHPFCCVSSTIPDPMTPPPAPPPAPAPPVTSSSDHYNNHNYSIKQSKVNNSNGDNYNNNGSSNNQSPSRYFSPPRLSRASQPPSRREIAQLAAAAAASGSASGAAKINDIVGNGISGILYKWVNYGKGWRPRWFVLQDGVLSYYKIHGPDKIVFSQESEKGARVIGEESFKRISRRNALPSSSSSQHKTWKPVGEVHLKVSSIGESRSDDKRFFIFTGTKRLHLRAENREDRIAWMEALQAVKDMFPRMSNSELLAPLDNVTVSTEKLRQRLLEAGVGEATIEESEQIMRSEFSALQSQLMLLKQKHWLLIDTLRQLEVHVMITRKCLTNEIQSPASVSSSQTFEGQRAFLSV